MQELPVLFGFRRHQRRRMFIAGASVLGILIVGVVGYSLLADLDMADAVYMTIITISTVGFTELGNFDSRTRLFASLLIVATLVWGAWALQLLLGTILSEEFRRGVHQLRSIRRTRSMENHTIICGYGRIGRSVAAELERQREPFIVLESDPNLVEALRDRGWVAIQGDATEDDVLLAAGIQQAQRLLAVLSTDNANIVTVLSARELNPQLWIASRVVQPDAEHKLRRAGANIVISPYDFGARRLVLTALRPHVAQFLSAVAFGEERQAEMDELELHPRSPWIGQTLGQINLRREFGVTVIALYHASSYASNYASSLPASSPRADGTTAGFALNPGSDAVLQAGDVLILVGQREHLLQLHQFLGA